MRSYGDDTHYSDSEKFMNDIAKPSKKYIPKPKHSYDSKYSKPKSSYKSKPNLNYNKPYMKFDDPDFKPNWSCAPNVNKSSSSKDSDNNIDWKTDLIIIIIFILVVLWFLAMFGSIMFH